MGHEHHQGHDHAHDGHEHEHEHEHEAKGPLRRGATGEFTSGEARQAKRLTLVLVLVSLFFFIEFAGALLARSNVLQADALHILMDIFALGMSLMAMRIAVRRPTPRFTFGLRRAEPVAALFNASLVLLAVVGIVWHAIDSLRGHDQPESHLMLYVAIGALVVNGFSAWLLHGVIGHHPGHDHGHDHGHGQAHDHGKGKAGGHEMNLRGARLHLLGDTLGSLAALVAAIIIRAGGPVSADPIASIVVAGILVFGAVRLLRDALLVLLEASPKHLNVNAIRRVIEAHPGVAEVHDMHVWSLGAGHDAVIAHIHEDGTEKELTTKLVAKLREVTGAEYVTVQVERPGEHCDAPPSRYAESD
jgi:cobalt-zinc-cadmium efflux system protein